MSLINFNKRISSLPNIFVSSPNPYLQPDHIFASSPAMRPLIRLLENFLTQSDHLRTYFKDPCHIHLPVAPQFSEILTRGGVC